MMDLLGCWGATDESTAVVMRKEGERMLLWKAVLIARRTFVVVPMTLVDV